jgi:hypothetical protein
LQNSFQVNEDSASESFQGHTWAATVSQLERTGTGNTALTQALSLLSPVVGETETQRKFAEVCLLVLGRFRIRTLFPVSIPASFIYITLQKKIQLLLINCQLLPEGAHQPRVSAHVHGPCSILVEDLFPWWHPKAFKLNFHESTFTIGTFCY